MPGFNTLPAVGGGGGQANMTFVASVHMETYNRSWAQGGTPGYYALYSTNQENGYAYFVGSTTTGVPLNRLANISHNFTRIDIIAPVNDMISLYKAKVKSTTEFPNPFAGFASFPSVITSSGNFVLPNNALPLVNVMVVGAGGNGGHHYCGGGGGGGGIVKLTAYQAVGTTSVTIGTNGGDGARVQAGASYFGNVYALGGGAGGHHDNNGATTGANGGGGGGHNSQQANRNGQPGIVQTSSTGLGTSGSPLYVGGHSGGNAGPNDDQQSGGGGGGGAGGAGTAGSTGSAGNGGAGHYSDITGTGHHWCYGAPGGRANNNSSQSFGSYTGTTDGPYGHGGRGAGYAQQGRGNGAQGAVVVRYYIP